MKTVRLFLTGAFILASIASFCQGTTQEEYNYITKGYKVQLESGLDMKKGYFFKELNGGKTTKGSEKRQCEFKALYRENSNKPCAILMVYKRTDISNGAEYYLCIPSVHSSDEIWDLAFKDLIAKVGNSAAMMDVTMIWGLMKCLSQSYTE